MHHAAYRLSQRRAVQESDGGTPGAVTSIFKVVGSELQQMHHDLQLEMRGPEGYTIGDADVKQWLFHRAASIYSGSNEVQRNILAKRVLGLPD
ncbi:MAG: acyl-CoA dehydrogenase family protein [Pseudomonadales bacterium]